MAMKPTDLHFAADAFEVPSGRGPIRVTWLGTAGFAIEHDGTVVLIDPYLTRASLPRLVAAPLRSDRAALCHVEGVAAAQVVDVEGAMRGEPVQAEVGPFTLRFIPSVHSAFMLGRVPFRGEISDCDQLPLRAEKYRCGAVFGVELRVAGKTLYHLGSADLLDARAPRDVDLLMMCVAGWTTTPRFTDRVMRAFTPRAIVLSHWDDFLSPMSAGAKMLPAMQLPRLVDGLTRVDPSVRLGALPLMGSIAL